MSELVHADIFFFITTIAVVILTAGLLILGIYVWKIVRDTREIVSRVKDMSAEVEQDFEALRHDIRDEGHKAKLVVDMVLGLLLRKSRSLVRKGKTSAKQSEGEN
ncbi:MAG: hypothetical protein Q7R88_03340 [bacterium]|nr:hypothetical protein [bacterium]